MSGIKRSVQGKFCEQEPPLARRRKRRTGDHIDGSGSGPASPGAESKDGIKQIPSNHVSNAGNMTSEFSSDSSLVLVGMRGAGKSTLAIMASSAMNKRVIDLETAFQSTSGIPSPDYKMRHGSKKCCEQQAKVLKNILDRHPNGYVLVCSWINGQIQNLLQEFSVTHPVILIIRDIEAISRLFDIKEEGKAWNLLRVSSEFFRSCTNFEFFNISEKGVLPHEVSSEPTTMQKPITPCLALKRTEKDFLSFLSSIYPVGTFLFTDPAFPLAKIAIEDRQFTYTTSIALSNLLESGIDIEDSITGSDSIQITVDDLVKELNEQHWRSKSTESHAVKLANEITKGLGKARRSTILPIMVHIALSETLEEHIVGLYLHLIHHTIRLAPEMVTIDLRLEESFISRVLASCKRTRVIGHCFIEADPPPWDSPLWLAWYKKANRLGCHVARLLRPALSFEDNITIGRLKLSVAGIDELKIPLTSYNTGHLGRTSAAFNSVLTVVETGSPHSAEKTKSCLLSSITALQATQALCSCFVYEALKFYVFGMQVDYSLSPAMLKAGFRACGISHDYRPLSSSSLRDVQNVIEDPYFGGASVGFPYKIEIVSLTNALSSHAEAIGAVNTIIPIRNLNLDGSVPEGAEFFRFVNRSGPIKAIYGENTDWIGIRACIRKGLSPANAVTSNTCGLVIGAGGMARATIYAMLQLGIENIVIFNRTSENAEKIISHFTKLLQKKKSIFAKSDSIRFYSIRSLDEEWPQSCKLPTIIVSCIPTHRIKDKPAPNFILPEAWLGSKTGGLIIDMGYKTLNTPLLTQARNWSSRGWVSMDGLDILPEQGFAQFELFTGKRAPRKIMRVGVLQAYCIEDGDPGQKELQARLGLVDEDLEEFANTI